MRMPVFGTAVLAYVVIGHPLASYTQAVLPAQSEADAIASALDELAGQESGESYVRTFASSATTA